MTGDRSRPFEGSLTRRAAVGTMAAAGAGFVLFGPRGRAQRTDGRIVLDYWEKWTSHEGAAMQRVVDEFNASQNRVFVRYFAMAGIDEKTQIAIAGGSPPDIVGLWNYNLPAFAASNAILPLDELAAPHGVSPSMYAQGVRRVVEFRGRMWAAVNTGGTLALYYNRAQFREVGLNPDQPPRTISELDEATRRLNVSEGRSGLTRVGFHPREPGWWGSLWGYQFGGSLYDEQTNTATIDQARNIAAYDWIGSFPRRFGLKEMNDIRSAFASYDSPLNGFLTGKVSMVLQGPWLANVINAYNPGLDYAVAPFPVADDLFDASAPIGLIDTDILVIPRGVKNPEASMEFIAFTQRQEIVERLATVHCKGSPLAASSVAFRKAHPNRGIEVFEAIGRSPRSYRVPPTRTWQKMRDELAVVFDDVWNQTSSAAPALARAQRRAQQAIDLAAQQEQRRTAERGA